MSLLNRVRLSSPSALAILAAAVFSPAGDAFAQVTWSKGAGTYDWNTATNWSTNAIPAATGTAIFATSTNGVPGTITLSTVSTATSLFVTTGGYAVSNNGTNFLSLTYNNSTGSGTSDNLSALWVSNNSTFNIGTGADSTVVKVNGATTTYSSQILIGSGSGATKATLNINAGATLLRDNVTTTSGGIRFVGSGTVNLYGSLLLGGSATQAGTDGIRISERKNDSITFNVKSGGAMLANTSATNESNGSIWVAGGATGTNSGVNALNVEAGGRVTVIPQAANAFGLTRNAGPTSVTNLSGTLTVPRVISLASTGTLNFTGGSLVANASNSNYITSGSFVGGTLASVSGGTIDNGGYTIGIGVGISGAGGMTFAGNGVTTLSGASTYAGTTSVNAGTLTLTGSLASAMSVASGAKATGSGTTSGSITFNAGSYLVANANATKLTGNGVTFGGQTLLQFTGAVVTGSTYDVIAYGAGGVTGVGNLVSTSRATLTNDVVNAKVTALIGGTSNQVWAGGSGTWQISGTATSWIGSDGLFFNGDGATFGTGGGAATVTLSTSLGTLLPSSVIVNGDTDYTFSGSGAIGGTAAVSKEGSGALTMATANSYSGGTTLTAGRLNVDNAAALGSGTVTINGGTLGNTSGGAITLSAAVPQTWAGDFTYAGPDSLTMGNGRVTLGGSGTRTITISSGTLAVGGITGTSVSGTLGFTKAGPGTLALNPTAIIGPLGSAVGDLTIADGTLTMGAFDLTTTGLTGSGTLTNGSNTTRWFFSVVSGGTKTFDGSLQDGAGTGKLGFNVSGGGTQIVNGNGSWSDTTTVNGATTKLVLNGVNTGTSYTDLQNGPTLQFGNAAALAAGSRVNMSGAQTATIVYATDGGDNAYAFQGSSNSTLNIVLDRATAGTSVTHPMSTPDVGVAGLGGGTLAVNLTRGGNVSGTATAAFAQFNLGGGSGGSTTLNPAAGTVVSIGSVTKSLNNVSQTLVLGGVTQGNVVTGVISNGASLTGGNAISLAKTNSSVWTLSGNSTYTGTTAVLGGVLYVHGDNAAATGAVTVAGGSLGGNGRLGGAITLGAGGVLVPGGSIGTLTAGQGVSFADGSTFGYELDSAAVTADLLRVATDLNIAGTVTLALTDLSASTLIPADTVLTLVNYGNAWNGGLLTFGGMTLADEDVFTFGTNQFRIDYNSETQGVNVANPIGANFLNLVAVPEPTATVTALASLGLAILVVRRRRIEPIWR